MNSSYTCKTCELTALRRLGKVPLWDSIYQTNFWDVVHAFDTSLPGWLVLVLQRHIESLDELTEQEAAELGALIRRVSLSLKAVVGCVKTYVIQFAEHEKIIRMYTSILSPGWLISLLTGEALKYLLIWVSLRRKV